MTEVTIRGERALRRKLGKLSGKHLGEALKQAGEHVATKTKIYPPQPPTTYVRQFHLMDSWKVKPNKRDFSVKVSAGGPSAPYAEYVHGERQASFHRAAGWKQLKKTAKEEIGEVVNILKRQVDRILRTG